MYGLNWDGGAAPAKQARPKYKVGQRVRVVKLGNEDGGSQHGGDVGDIVKITAIDLYDPTPYEGDVWFYKEHEIQPAFLPGDHVRVTKHSGYFAVGDTGEVERQTDTAVFVTHGPWRAGLPLDADALELIAEPEAGNNVHTLSVVEAIADIFDLTERPCIVARVLDGTPRPSNVPFVHSSVQSATVEAERLAKNNPGQEFAVYQRVAGRVAEVEYSMMEVA